MLISNAIHCHEMAARAKSFRRQTRLAAQLPTSAWRCTRANREPHRAQESRAASQMPVFEAFLSIEITSDSLCQDARSSCPRSNSIILPQPSARQSRCAGIGALRLEKIPKRIRQFVAAARIALKREANAYFSSHISAARRARDRDGSARRQASALLTDRSWARAAMKS